MSRRDPRMRSALAVLLSASLLAAAAPAADADPETQVVQGRYVRIVSSVDGGAAAAMGQGAGVRWDLEISAAAPSPGTVRVGLSAKGDAPVTADVILCAVAWHGDACAGAAQVLRRAWTVPRDGRTVLLDAISSDDVAHLRLIVRLVAGGGTGATQIRVHADGLGDRIQAGTGEQLPPTGGAVPLPAIAGGGALLLAAALLQLLGRRRRGEGRRRRESS